MLMSPPYQVIISPKIWGSQSVSKEYPPNCIYKISIADHQLITVKDALFSFQTFIGLDYLLELWSFSIKRNDKITMKVTQPFIALVVCLNARNRPFLDIASKVKEKNYSLCYYPKGIYDMSLGKGDTIIAMIIPPLCDLHSMAVEHFEVRNMYTSLQFGGTGRLFLNELPLPNKVVRIIKILELSREYAASLDYIMRTIILQILLLYNNQLESSVIREGITVLARVKTIEQIIKYIDENLLDDSINETKKIAQSFKISLTTLRKEFKQVAGKSIQNYIRDRRLNYARKLLEESSLQIFEVAEIIRYSSTSNFDRAYKKMFGHAPRQKK